MINGKKVISLCVPRINSKETHILVTSMNNCLPDENWALLVYATPSELFEGRTISKGQSAIFDLIDYENTDAVVIFEEKFQDKEAVLSIIARAQAFDKPVVIIGGDYDGCISTRFIYDDGFDKIVDHVIEHHGCRKLRFMAGMKDNEFSDLRIAVFAKALAGHGIPFDRSMISYGDFWSEPAKAATEEVINSGDIPDAFICANDSMAIVVAATFIEHGYRVPEDIIVTGFDGIDDIKFCNPTISSCMCSYEQMAKDVVDLVQEAIASGKRTGFRGIMPSLILAESCGCNMEQPMNPAEVLFSQHNSFHRFQGEELRMFEMSSKILTCGSIEEVSQVIKDNNIYDFNCVLKAECIDDKINPMAKTYNEGGYGSNVMQIVDTDFATESDIIRFDSRNQLPELAQYMNYGYPIVFCGLNCLDVPLGYGCFHFHNNDIINYIKIPQIIGALNNAITTYRNMRYQHHMTWQIEEMYKLDNLTNLYNRNGFIREYHKLTSKRKKDERLTVIMADLDGLKSINDRYGHDEGDNAIRLTATALKTCCPKGTLCVRFGGDEMLAVYNGFLDEKALRHNIEIFLEEYNAQSGKPYTVSASIGVYMLDSYRDVDLDELIKKSDKLMYFDKERKKHDAETVS